MLDVHPPHHSPNTWRDFLLHIATIVVGLLIAIGLEQTVEYVHHRREVAETREALRREHRRNDTIARYTLQEYRRVSATLQMDLSIFLYLRQHPGAAEKDWPGKFNWSRWTIGPDESAWETAQKSTVLSFMPAREVREENNYYSRMQALHVAQTDFANAMMLSQTYRIRVVDASHMSPGDIDKELDLLTNALFLHVKEGIVAANITANFPDFVSPAREEIFAVMHTQYAVDPVVAKSYAELKQTLERQDSSNHENP